MIISIITSISKILTDLCAIKKINKKHFCRYCLQCFSSEKVFMEHKKACLKINGKQSVKLKSGSIKFKNNFKQSAAQFKVYADFECILRKNHSDNKNNNASYTKKYQDPFTCSFAYKAVLVMIILANQLFLKNIIIAEK